jgi:hypothetical protein
MCTGAFLHLRDVSNSTSTFLQMHEENISSSCGVCLASSGKYVAVQQTIRDATARQKTCTEGKAIQQAWSQDNAEFKQQRVTMLQIMPVEAACSCAGCSVQHEGTQAC